MKKIKKKLRTCTKDSDRTENRREITLVFLFIMCSLILNSRILVNYVQLTNKTKITNDILMYRDRIEESSKKKVSFSSSLTLLSVLLSHKH